MARPSGLEPSAVLLETVSKVKKHRSWSSAFHDRALRAVQAVPKGGIVAIHPKLVRV